MISLGVIHMLMSTEGFDLNSLKRPQEEKIIQSKEEQIADLKTQIARYREELLKPSPRDEFLALSREEQNAKLAEMNARMALEHQDTVESYLAGMPATGLNKWQLRLGVAKAKLEQLQSEEGGS